MRVHEVVIVVAMLFAGSNVAGAMARRDAPLKVSEVRTAAARQGGRAGEVADGESNPCARTAEYEIRCDPARPRALDNPPVDSDPSVAAAKGRDRRR